MRRSENIEKDMVGKTIGHVSVDGFGVEITFTDGSVFSYDASDGGYSSYSLKLKDGGQ